MAGPPPSHVLVPWSQQSISPQPLRAPRSAGSFCHGIYPFWRLFACFFSSSIHGAAPPSRAKIDEGLPLATEMCLQTSSLGVLLPGGGAFGPGPPIWVEEAIGGCFCGRASMEVEHTGHHQGPGRISPGFVPQVRPLPGEVLPCCPVQMSSQPV